MPSRAATKRQKTSLTPAVAPAVTLTQSITTTGEVTYLTPVMTPAQDELNVTSPITAPFEWSQTENYLILGTDRRRGTSDWRTDTIILVGIDRANRRAAFFSIPRDLYVQIPNYGWGRINQVDYLGERRQKDSGPMLVSQVLSQTLGVVTQHWLRVQMDGFIDFVDTIGGVTVQLDCPFSEPILNLTTGQWDEFTLPAGEVQMDGETAYWFVRLRLRESDIGRSNRQRQFLWALREKVLQTNLITRAPELWTTFQNSFSTDLNIFQMLEIGVFGLGLQPENVRASGLTLADLQNYTTAEGAAVLRIGDPARAFARLNGVWSAPPLAASYRSANAGCLGVAGLATAPNAQPSAAEIAAGYGYTATEQGAASSRVANPAIVPGKRVRIKTGLSIDVRSQPGSEQGRVVGVMTDGEQAVILGGPSAQPGAKETIVWWYLRTDGGAEGWAPANSESERLLEIMQ